MIIFEKRFFLIFSIMNQLSNRSTRICYIWNYKCRWTTGNEDILSMTRFEKRLAIVALIFVVIYLGAAVATINTRILKEDRIERLESTKISPSEGRLLMAELFLPMAILLTLTVSFIVVRKQRARKIMELEESDDEFEFPDESQQDDNERVD